MRLICPNCDAQYEVPTEVIPEGGRDVQCSNCGHTWYQQHPDDQEGLLSLDAIDRLDDEDGLEPTAPPRPRARDLDPAVADVLRQEAAREAKARMADALESQPDLGLEEAGQPADRSSRPRRGQHLRDAPPADHVDAAANAAAAAAAAPAARGTHLPDVEEINSTLRNGSETRRVSTPDGEARIAPRSGAFGRGFRWVVSLAVLAVLLYLFAPQIGGAIPETAELLERYVLNVDKGRVWLDVQVDQGLLWLDDMSSEAGASGN
ncbi:MAG: zinc-ribbon domain-containing protein [Rhodobacteraceae bacterium]|nr:zinc-ribbon domain-containing protein [Paracoccaceae bacterium]